MPRRNPNQRLRMSAVLLSSVRHIPTRRVDRYEAYYVLTLKVQIEVSLKILSLFFCKSFFSNSNLEVVRLRITARLQLMMMTM
jgi:hypothetical protein